MNKGETKIKMLDGITFEGRKKKKRKYILENPDITRQNKPILMEEKRNTLFYTMKIRVKDALAQKIISKSKKERISVNFIVNRAIEDGLVGGDNCKRICLDVPNEFLEQLIEEAKGYNMALEDYLIIKILNQ